MSYPINGDGVFWIINRIKNSVVPFADAVAIDAG